MHYILYIITYAFISDCINGQLDERDRSTLYASNLVLIR